MFLTYTELVELTDKRRHVSQAKALGEMGILYRLRSDGTVAVAKAHVEQIMGVVRSSAAKREPELHL
jgi:hypothetical protein